MPFDRCVQEWNNLIGKYDVKKLKFYVGLAVYRIGEPSQQSDLGWRDESGTILRDQQLYCKNNLKNYCGFCLFDYKSVFNKNGSIKQICEKEINKLNSEI